MIKQIRKGRYRPETITALLTAVLLIALGLWRQEAAVVLEKGINLCLECVGIG